MARPLDHPHRAACANPFGGFETDVPPISGLGIRLPPPPGCRRWVLQSVAYVGIPLPSPIGHTRPVPPIRIAFASHSSSLFWPLFPPALPPPSLVLPSRPCYDPHTPDSLENDHMATRCVEFLFLTPAVQIAARHTPVSLARMAARLSPATLLVGAQYRGYSNRYVDFLFLTCCASRDPVPLKIGLVAPSTCWFVGWLAG